MISAGYSLFIVKNSEDSLFVVNLSTEPFPLAPLQLGDGLSAINGTEWELETLDNNACVSAWKAQGRPQAPDGLTCANVGQRLERGGGDRFWREDFNVYYNGALLGTCTAIEDECLISIPF